MTRSVGILIRVSPEERDRLNAAARSAGLGLGPWLRMLGLREAGEQGPAPRRRKPTAS